MPDLSRTARQFLELSTYFANQNGNSKAARRAESVRFSKALAKAGELIAEAADAGSLDDPLKSLADFHRERLQEHPLWPETTKAYQAGIARRVRCMANLFSEAVSYLRQTEFPLPPANDGLVLHGSGKATLHGTEIDSGELGGIISQMGRDTMGNRAWGCKLLAELIMRRKPLPPRLDAPDLAGTTSALTLSEQKTLRALADIGPELLASVPRIAGSMGVDDLSERTIVDAVKRLVELGFADRPQGPKQGARATAKGLKLAGKIAS